MNAIVLIATTFAIVPLQCAENVAALFSFVRSCVTDNVMAALLKQLVNQSQESSSTVYLPCSGERDETRMLLMFQASNRVVSFSVCNWKRFGCRMCVRYVAAATTFSSSNEKRFSSSLGSFMVLFNRQVVLMPRKYSFKPL